MADATCPFASIQPTATAGSFPNLLPSGLYRRHRDSIGSAKPVFDFARGLSPPVEEFRLTPKIYFLANIDVNLTNVNRI
jgi:hypothetical protein